VSTGRRLVRFRLSCSDDRECTICVGVGQVGGHRQEVNRAFASAGVRSRSWCPTGRILTMHVGSGWVLEPGREVAPK
jgi:hypothetical protein